MEPFSPFHLKEVGDRVYIVVNGLEFFLGGIMKRLLFSAGVFSSILVIAIFSPWKSTQSESENSQVSSRAAFSEARMEYEKMLHQDPMTGEIPWNIRERERAFAEKLPRRKAADDLVFTPRGPGNLGGRTRAIAFDITDPSGNTILAGGVSSGVFRTTNGGASWEKVTGNDDIHSVTSIVQDPTSPNVWYYGTGEVYVGSLRFGDGIWKSVDNGLTWSQLASTASNEAETLDNSFDIVHRLAVNPTNGDLYAAVHRRLFRSTDGGDSFLPVLSTQTPTFTFSGLVDIAITSDGSSIYAAFHGGITDNLDGVWRSSTGDANSWTSISQGREGWPANGDYGRVVLALAPSQQNLLYVLFENGNVVVDCDDDEDDLPEADLWLYDSDADSWVDLSDNMPDDPDRCLTGNEPFAVQGGYDLVVGVSPLDPNMVFVGGTNLYRSTTGFSTVEGTRRMGGYQSPASYQLYPNHHPDIHFLAFDPSDPRFLVSGSDGGIHRTFASDTIPQWTNLNNDYVTYQYYHVAAGPGPGDQRILGGAQDNGTSFNDEGTDHFTVFGGDGVSVGIGNNEIVNGEEAGLYYLGFQSGNIFRLNTEVQNFVDIKPEGSGHGLFVTLFQLDSDNTDLLYYADNNKIYRTSDAVNVTSDEWVEMTGIETTLIPTGLNPNPQIQAIALTRGPYQTTSRMYLGDTAGRIFKFQNPRDGDPAEQPENITPTGALPGPDAVAPPVVSQLSVDAFDHNVLMAVYSNYNIPGIFVTSDGGSSWTNVDGNLSLSAKRSAAIVNIDGQREYFVGTSFGLWHTKTLNGAETVWERVGVSTIGGALVSDLEYRPSDHQLLVGTYGNGVFTINLDKTVTSKLTSRYHLAEIQSGSGVDTVVGILNSGTSAQRLDIYGYGSDGETLGRSTYATRIPAGGVFRFNVAAAFPDTASRLKWIQVASDGELDVYAEIMTETTRSAYKASVLEGQVLMPHIARDTASFETVLSAVNGTQGDTSCFLTERPGGQSFSITETGAAFGRSSRPITDYLGQDLIDGPNLWGEVSCPSEGLAAMEFFTRLPGRTQQAALGLDGKRGQTLNFLHVATNTNLFWTGMLYINVGNAQTKATETYYDNNGGVLISRQTTVQPGGKETLFFDYQNQERVPAGTAWVQVTADQDLIGYELFGTPDISSNDTFTGLQGNYGGGRVVNYPHVISNESMFTGLVALNLGEEAADIVFTAYSSEGVALESSTKPNVGAKTKLAVLALELFSETTLNQAAWVGAETTGSEWAGFLLWGDLVGDRTFMSGINAQIQ